MWAAHTHRTRTQSSMQAASLYLGVRILAGAAGEPCYMASAERPSPGALTWTADSRWGVGGAGYHHQQRGRPRRISMHRLPEVDSYDCPRTDSSPRPATFQLRYNDVHVCVWFATLPRCPVDNPAFHSAPIRIPSQPSCPQLPRKLHVLTSPVVLAFISCMLYIARSVFNWRCPISPDTGRSQEGMRCSRHLAAKG